jgi:hypothetical protein
VRQSIAVLRAYLEQAGSQIEHKPSDPRLASTAVKAKPELQRRGLFRREYSGSTPRDHVGLTRPTVAPGLKSA